MNYLREANAEYAPDALVVGLGVYCEPMAEAQALARKGWSILPR